MTSAALQWLAFFTMLIDHVGYTFFPGLPVLRAIGRISFPIFAFLLSEGFVHTASVEKYAARLLIFAVISEIPYQFVLYHRLVGFRLSNILFALLLSLLALCCVKRGGSWPLAVIPIAAFAQVAGFSYGGYGVALVVAFYLTRRNRSAMVLSLAACTLLYCIAHQSFFQIYAILAAVPLLFYNGQRGHRAPRYLLYILYPTHLILLALGWFWVT